MIEWKPIEEAPKDGRYLMVCDQRDYPESLGVVRYDLHSETFIRFFESRHVCDEYFSDLRYCTHYAEIGEGP